MSQKRILLGQLASNGDCLYATTIARQIKTDFPDCHLTWAISARCRPMIDGNPDVDAVWEVAPHEEWDIAEEWKNFEIQAKRRARDGEFDEIFLTQISPATFHLWTGSVRAAILRAYPRPITVDTTPVLRLSPGEVERVARFAELHRLAEKSAVILFECAPRSQQSRMNPQFALDVAARVVEKHPDVALILSSNCPIVSTHPNIIDGSVLSLRENAELTKHCSLLIGCSSGVTWIATSDWAKPLPMLQLVIPDLVRSNSLVYDFQRRGQDTSGVIEMNTYSLDDVVSCLDEVVGGGFSSAMKFHQITPLGFGQYADIQYYFLAHLQWNRCLQLLIHSIKEFGLRPRFVLILGSLFLKRFFLAFRKVAMQLKRLGFRR